jgi:hypothetical protein
LRDPAKKMREAVVAAKVAVQEMRAALARLDVELEAERQRLGDAERRGRLAAEIQDQETVAVAQRFAAKHRERVAVLERKAAAQRDELALAERELGEMQAQLKAAGREAPSTEAAWRDVQQAGGVRPDVDLEHDALKADAERQAREAAADRQLADLKKRMKKN